jgi:hypothetical protein
MKPEANKKKATMPVGSGAWLGSIREIIKDTMYVVENLPMGGIGEDGPSQDDLDAANNEGHPIGQDAVYHAGQQIWLNLKKALDELNAA